MRLDYHGVLLASAAVAPPASPFDPVELRSMSDDALVAEIVSLLRKVVPHELGACDLHSSLTDDIGIDSLGSYELMMDAEDRFGIEISDEQLANLKTIADIVALIRNNVD
jgi:acyl carrier protein